MKKGAKHRAAKRSAKTSRIGAARSAGAEIALQALAELVTTHATTARSDDFGQGWNAAMHYVAGICRGKGQYGAPDDVFARDRDLGRIEKTNKARGGS